jgi:hypothetical protein
MLTCLFIGNLIQHIFQRDSRDTTTRAITEYNDILDLASQTLLPRFTDKSQQVRSAAIHAGSFFFLDDKTDPDILTAMLWSLQHDPSVANRQAACLDVPLNLATIDYVISRVRDVNAKVRCAALERLSTAFNSGILDSQQAVTVILAGWTDR